MSILTYRVASRFLFGEVIADPKEKLHEFQTLVEDFCRHEEAAKSDLGKIREFISAMDRKDFDTSKRLSTELTKTSGIRYDIKGDLQLSLRFKRTQAQAQMLFWSILQQYALPPQVQRGIESASRFWTKKKIVVRIKSSPGTYDADVEWLEAYLKLCAELSSQVTNAQSAIVKGKLHSDPEVAAKTKFTVGSFTVVNTGNFNEKVMSKVIDVVSKAEKAMRSAGLGKVCYGDVLITKTVNNKRTVAAFYVLDSDEMFIRANTPDDWDTTRYVCHELAHRLERKFLQGKYREIEAIYRTLKREEGHGDTVPLELMPVKGETLTEKGKLLTVTSVRPLKGEVEYQIDGDPPGVRNALSIESWLRKKGIKPREHEGFKGFITHYAKTNSSENFAEMVSFYVLGKLPQSQVELLKPILE